MLGGGAHVEVHTINKIEDLERLATEVAARAPFDCVVWCGPKDRDARKPRGFDNEARRLHVKFCPKAPAAAPAPMQCGACAQIGTNATRKLMHSPSCSEGGAA